MKTKILIKSIKKIIFIYISYNYKVSSINSIIWITKIVLLTQNRKCCAMTTILTHIYVIAVVYE